jgi:hypothetical protein
MNPIAWPVYFFLNLLCKRKLKREGWTDEDMAELQRRMLGGREATCKESLQVRVEVMEAAE